MIFRTNFLLTPLLKLNFRISYPKLRLNSKKIIALDMFSGEGILHLLVLVTGCNSVGKIGHSEVYRVSNVQMISLRGKLYRTSKAAGFFKSCFDKLKATLSLTEEIYKFLL